MNAYLCDRDSGHACFPFCAFAHCWMIYPLRCAWHQAIIDSVDKVSKDCQKRNKAMQEPDFSVALSVELANQLVARTPPHIAVGACFAHQTPWVSLQVGVGSSVYCEAGDLLVLCRKLEDGQELYNAALLQLKMTDDPISYRITGDKECRQLKVYRDWPSLSLGKKFDSNHQFDVQPQAPTPGAQYLLVSGHRIPAFTLAAPAHRLSTDGLHFAHFMCQLMNWNTGRPISKYKEDDDQYTDEWSRFIWALVRKINGSTFTRSSAGYPKHSGRRMPDTLAKLFFSEDENCDACAGDTLLYNHDGPDSNGIGVLFIDQGICD